MNPKLLPWSLFLVTFCIAAWAKYQLVESRELSIFCHDGGRSLACDARSLFEQVFYNNLIGVAILGAGLLALALRSVTLAAATGVFGVAALVLHDSGSHQATEFPALGFLFAALTLARLQWAAGRA